MNKGIATLGLVSVLSLTGCNKTEEGASYDPCCIGLNEFKSTKNQEHGHHNEIKLSSGWNYCFVCFGVQKPDVESIEFKDTTILSVL